jgi:Domain of unknown function (DUF4157)
VSRPLNETEIAAYDVLPRALAERVRVIKVPALAPGSSGMTIGRFVFVTADETRDGTRRLLAHELVHVRQWHELGVRRFLMTYLSSYARQLVRLRSHRKAYRAITLEVEAYDLADAWTNTRRNPATDPRA